MAKLKELNTSLGMSMEINGVWYRPNVSITLELDETDTGEKRKKIFEKAWEMVTEEIEKQINELTK